MRAQRALEERIRRLEIGLDDFDGEQWILRVGDIARVKSVVLDMGEETSGEDTGDTRWIEDVCLSRLDALIEEATAESRSPAQRRQAFDQACALLRTELGAVGGDKRAL